MQEKSNKDWFVVCTKARQELKVLERLSQLEIETYTPTKTEVKYWSDRRKIVNTCLLPSMVLVRLPNNELNKVFEVPGVKKYLFVALFVSKIKIQLNKVAKFVMKYGMIRPYEHKVLIKVSLSLIHI